MCSFATMSTTACVRSIFRYTIGVSVSVGFIGLFATFAGIEGWLRVSARVL
jgi:hypothetical protein